MKPIVPSLNGTMGFTPTGHRTGTVRGSDE
jgi:hypothetical protein